MKIDGDCGMCEKTIEKAGFMKGESEVDWDVDTHMARVTFDSTRTDLMRSCNAWHTPVTTTNATRAEGSVHKLPGCCQYERTL